jgi:NodT family efflux transporter outer membrane factor (OMF) lipoprotein
MFMNPLLMAIKTRGDRGAPGGASAGASAGAPVGAPASAQPGAGSGLKPALPPVFGALASGSPASRSFVSRSLISLSLMSLPLLSLTGCAMVGPDYRKPASVLTLPFQHQEAVAAHNGAAGAPALDQWWLGFGDPMLTRIVERALGENLDLAGALARVEQARAVADRAGAERLPAIGVDSSVARQHQSLQSPLGKIARNLPGYDRNQTLYDIGAGASWELDLAGGLKRGAQAAGADLEAARAEHAGVRIMVVAEAADAYFRARGARERIALAQEQVRAGEGLMELVQLRLQGGLSSVREKSQAQAVLAQARATIPPLRAELERQLNRLDVLMGAQPGTYAAELKAAISSRDAIHVPAIGLYQSQQATSEVLRRRPDVIAAERRLAASNARIGQALAEYYPKLSLSAVLGFVSLGATGLFGGDSFQPTAIAGLKWRLFDFGRIDAEVAQARGANSQALAAYRQSMLRAAEEVENAVVALTELEAQSRELQEEVGAHAEAREAARDSYKGGAVSLVEVLEEDRQLLVARDQLARANTDSARAAVAAFRSMGGGW